MDVPIPYLQAPSFIVNQALDRIGADEDAILGDITDGTRVAETARRNYGQALRQLLRTAHWNFARKRATLTLLGDASAASALPVINQVEPGWLYAYAWPVDAVQGRWLPWSPATAQPTTPSGLPLTTGVSAATTQWNQVPGRFLVSSSNLYPIEIGNQPWIQQPDLQRTEGLGPVNRKIILTDCASADFVYTRLVTTIEEWDDSFREAMVMMMAMVLAPVALKDPKMRIEQMNRLVPALKNTVADARVTNGNEASWPQTTDFESSYIRGRNSGPWGGAGWGRFGTGDGFSCGWDSFSWSGNSF